MNNTAEIKKVSETSPSGKVRIKLVKTISPDRHAYLYEGKRTLHTFNRNYHTGIMGESKIVHLTPAGALKHLKDFCNDCKN